MSNTQIRKQTSCRKIRDLKVSFKFMDMKNLLSKRGRKNNWI